MEFRHEVIDADPPTQKLVFCHTSDLTGNGQPDVIVGGKGARDRMWLFGSRTTYPDPRYLMRKAVSYRTANVIWYENPGWERHIISDQNQFEVGSAVGDLTGDGQDDLVAGRSVHYSEVYWFEQPVDPTEPWTRRMITDDFEMYHDLRIADIDGDGDPEVVGLSQADMAVFYYDVPDDPTREPWPAEDLHVLADDLSVEGATIADFDADGQPELLAGTTLFSRDDGDGWCREQIANGWDAVRSAAADFDGDGRLEVVLAEGDSPTHGTHPGRVAVFNTETWSPTFLRDDLFCPHSLQIADFNGDGHPDIYVGEMGLGDHDDPRHLVFLNDGEGNFKTVTVDTGVPTHEAKAVDLTGNGRPDIVGKSFHPERHVDVWYNETK